MAQCCVGAGWWSVTLGLSVLCFFSPLTHFKICQQNINLTQQPMKKSPQICSNLAAIFSVPSLMKPTACAFSQVSTLLLEHLRGMWPGLACLLGCQPKCPWWIHVCHHVQYHNGPLSLSCAYTVYI